MHELTSLEIGLLVREFKRLEGSRIRKFYDLGNGAFKIALYKSPDTRLVYVKLMKAINITEFSEAAGEATQFAMAMRKRIENSVVDSIQQMNNDRIIRFVLDKGRQFLVLEMYGKGNLILTGPEGTIEVSYKRLMQKSREIKKGARYEYAESASHDILSMDGSAAARISEDLRIGKTLISSLSKSLSLGPLYLEDIIMRAGLDPNAAGISGEQAGRLAKEILGLGMRISTEKPRIYLKDGKTVDYAACSILKYEGMMAELFDTMSQLLDRLYLGERSSVPDTARQEKLKELAINIEKQEHLAKRLAAESRENAVIGNAILANMNQVNALCAYLTQNRRATLEEVRGAFPGLRVKELDLKNKTVKIELEA